MNKLIITFFFCFLLVTSVFSQSKNESNDVPLKSYEFVQFISLSGKGPQQIALLDNNSEILMACLNGKTKAQLRDSGIQFVESQIDLLKMERLLEEKNGLLKTTIPILNDQKSNLLREKTKTIGSALSPQLEPLIVKLTDRLNQI